MKVDKGVRISEKQKNMFGGRRYAKKTRIDNLRENPLSVADLACDNKSMQRMNLVVWRDKHSDNDDELNDCWW